MLKKYFLVIASLGISPVALAVKGEKAKTAKAQERQAEKEIDTLEENVAEATEALKAATETWSNDFLNTKNQAKLRKAQERLKKANAELLAAQYKLFAQQQAQRRKEANQNIEELFHTAPPIPDITEQPQIKIVENVLLFGGLVTSAGLLAPEVYAADKEAKTFHKRLSFAYAKTVAQLCKEQLKAKKKKCFALGIALSSALTGAGMKMFF